MADFAAAMAKPTNMSEAAQVKVGAPLQGDMGDEHKRFAVTISTMLENGTLDVTKPETFLNQSVYDGLDQEWKAKTDMSMLNIATLLGHIYDFYKSKQTPDACPQLATMIEQLWEMKQRIEDHADVFKF
jgi:hypothetical protein